MVDGVITETGQIVQLIVDQEHKPGPRIVQTLLQLMVVQIVLGRRLKFKTVPNTSAQVNNACIFKPHFSRSYFLVLNKSGRGI